jgi:CRP-like cAMP-binding protein
MDSVVSLILENLTPGKLVGHLSYILLIVSMLMRTMTMLRIIAVSAGVVSAAYGFFWLNDPVTVFWETIFVLTNLGQLLILWFENRRTSFSEEEQMFVDSAIPGVEKAHARRLLRRGEWHEAEAGEILIDEDQIAPRLIFLVKGAVSIERAGKIVGVCGHSDFLGEMSFMSGKPATATAVVANQVRYLSFDRDILKSALERDKEVRHAMESSFNRNLVGKLAKSNESRNVDKPGLVIAEKEKI